MSDHGTSRERLERLMMAALDGELGPGERTELEIALERDGALRAEWERFNELEDTMKTMRVETPADEAWGGYWHSVYNRLERGLGWILASVGALVLTLYGLWHAVDGLLADPGVPWIVKAGVFTLLAGGAILGLSVLREKLFTRGHDPYKEIER